MRGPPVVLTNTLGRPVTNVISERGAVPMVVVNTLGEPVTLVARGGEPVTLFNPNGTLWDYPFSLFANNEQGAWYDPSDFSTLYQNSTGTTPVTAVEQPVGLMLDRSRGLVLGSNIAPAASALTTSSIDNAGGASSTFSAGVFSITVGSSSSSYPRARISVPGLTVGKTYQVRGTSAITGTIAGVLIRLATGGSANNVATAATTSFDGIAVCAVTDVIEISPTGTGATGTITISSLTVEEIPGNHAFQATSASRPVLRARYNQLTYSEQFDNAVWGKDFSGGGSSAPVVTANYGVAPDGTTTADRIQFTRGASGFSRAIQSQTVPAGTYTYSIWLRNTSGSSASVSLRLDATNGAALSLTETWQRVSLTISYAGGALSAQLIIWDTISGSPLTADILAWGAQLQTSADQTSTGGAYQRIAAATDYDVSNPVWRPYLAFDGVDDFFNLASAISITTDMTVVRGFGRSAAGISSFGIGESSATTQRDFTWASTNDITSGLGASNALMQSGNTTTGYMVSVSRRNVSTEVIRLNGTQNGSRSAAAVSGSLNQLGRLGPSAYGIGPIYGLIVLDRELTGSELTATEQWMAGKTGAVLA